MAASGRARDPIVIVGGGCAGLSLALACLRLGVDRELRILEPRRRYENDRTWCFWPERPGPLDGLISHRWTRWLFRAGAQRVVHNSTSPYVLVPAARFYSHALETIAASGTVSLELDTRVTALVDIGDAVEVCTESGRIRASLVFDSRPPELHQVPLLQHFVGWEVETEEPIFDPQVVTLMDFNVSQEDGLQFLYVLPFEPRRGLIEATFMSPTVQPNAVYEQTLRDHLTKRRAGGWQILRQERGVLPMTTRLSAQARSPRVVPLGLRAGTAKPSTGYAFAFIQQRVEAIAAALASGAPIPPRIDPRPSWVTALDEIFLSVLRRRPDLGPTLFLRLFERLPAEAVVRFLSERATPSDVLAVIAAMPTLPFALEALRRPLREAA